MHFPRGGERHCCAIFIFYEAIGYGRSGFRRVELMVEMTANGFVELRRASRVKAPVNFDVVCSTKLAQPSSSRHFLVTPCCGLQITLEACGIPIPFTIPKIPVGFFFLIPISGESENRNPDLRFLEFRQFLAQTLSTSFHR
jgi:hypothetical protein